MVSKQAILEILLTIPDPEMPISIVDLGIVESVDVQESNVKVELLPTFVGCLALPAIAEEVKKKVSEINGINHVTVDFIYDPPWSTDRMTEQGKLDLAEMGIAVPDGACCSSGSEVTQVELQTSAIKCPWCDSEDTAYTSAFGPTRCRSIHYCNACRQPFERMKQV